MLIVSLLLSVFCSVMAQGRLSDYQRYAVLKTKLKDKVYNAPQQLNCTTNGNRYWYVVQTERSKKLVVVDPKQKTQQTAFDKEELARKLSTATGKKMEPYNLPFTKLTFGKDDEGVELVAEGFICQYDRILWLRAAAQKYSFMDLNRVGIYGTSAGGQSAAGALLFHPEFYKVAVSSCGCHDNRMDKMWWNEQWMGYPIGPRYT